MVAHVLRLRLALMLGALRGDRVVRIVVGLLALAAATVAVCTAVLSLADAPLAVARTVLVLGGAAPGHDPDAKTAAHAAPQSPTNSIS